jgi:S-adenosylmethionine synthetase
VNDTYVFTSESVAKGHPDKVCDIISDTLLDTFLQKDPFSRCAIETMVGENQVVLSGEISCKGSISKEQINHIVREAIKNIGYEQEGFHWRTVAILNLLHQQSEDIALGVNIGGAGDQGMMFGYATNELELIKQTNALNASLSDSEKGLLCKMPAALFFAHRIEEEIEKRRQEGLAPFLLPDGKCQVSLRYENGLPTGVEAIVLSHQHTACCSRVEIETLAKSVLNHIFSPFFSLKNTKIFINPTGRFVIGGPVGDTGLTGRKIIVDTYGGAAPHGGGAFSGKDPSKVDRSAAYMMRWLAKNIVAAHLADKCLLQVAYAIGVKEPVSFYINAFGTEKVPLPKLRQYLLDNIDMSPNGIRDTLDLCKPIYAKTACYGHFGRTPEKDGSFSWEKTELAEQLQKELF